MDKFINDFSQFGELCELPNLLRTHLIKRLPTKLFLLFKSTQNILWYFRKLSKRIHTCPHSFINHFCKFKALLCDLTPTSFHTDFKKCSHNSRCWLGNKNFIHIQSISFQWEFWNMSLQQYRYFRCRIFNSSFNGNRDTFHEFIQLYFLLFSDRNIFKLQRHGEYLKKFYESSVGLQVSIVDGHRSILYIIVWWYFP